MTEARPLLAHITTTDISLELLLGNQLEAFAAAGYEVVGVSAPGPYVAALERRGIRHVPLRHATRSFAPLQDARALAELTAVFRRLRPAIVHTHNPKPGLYGRAAARLAKVPVVVNTVHGLYALPEDRLAKRVVVYGLERLACVFSQVELLQNPEDLPTLVRLGVPAHKLTLLGNGVDLAHFDRSAVSHAEACAARVELGSEGPDDVVVGLVGRLVREKGFVEVFEAARRLRAAAPHLRFAVIGSDDDAKHDALSTDERALARAAGVRFMGARDDMARLYAGMDLFVLASHREGFPRSAMEAAAMALPIVATDIRGCRQVVDDGTNGVLVAVRDPDALVVAIGDLAASPDRRLRFGAAGREKAMRDFDERRCISITLETYRRLLAAGLAPGTRPDAVTDGRDRDDSALRFATLADAAAVAELHANRIHEGFLVTLGPVFLRRLYRRVVRSSRSFVLVAADGDEVYGFVAVAERTGALYREFLLRDGMAAAAAAIPAIVRSPRAVLETLRYGLRGGGDGPHAEILATGVAAGREQRGVGARLVRAATSELGRRGVRSARVVTSAGNVAALRTYERGGFHRSGVDEVHRGVTQELLVWP